MVMINKKEDVYTSNSSKKNDSFALCFSGSNGFESSDAEYYN